MAIACIITHLTLNVVRKFEIRSTKFETSTKFKIFTLQDFCHHNFFLRRNCRAGSQWQKLSRVKIQNNNSLCRLVTAVTNLHSRKRQRISTYLIFTAVNIEYIHNFILHTLFTTAYYMCIEGFCDYNLV